MFGSSVITDVEQRPEGTALDLLVKDRRKFLNFVRTSVDSFDDAEEIIQRASVKILSKSWTLRDQTRAEAWIYRVLRNEISDYFRRLAVQSKRTAAFSEEILSSTLTASLAGDSNPCLCAAHELTTLRANYSDALRAVELNLEPIAAYAHRKGITANNAMVLLHRARRSLRTRLKSRCGSCADAGCFDCSCSA